MLLNSMKQPYTNSLVFRSYKTRTYLLKHHKLGPVQTVVTVETYRQESGQDSFKSMRNERHVNFRILPLAR